MFKNKVSFQKFQSDVPIIKFSLPSGVEFNALIDTGSESTVFDADFVSKNSNQFSSDAEHAMSLVGLGGDIVHTVKNVSTTLILNHKKFLISGITTDLSNVNNHIHMIYDVNVSLILGCDILKQFGAILDFREQSASFNI